MKMLYGIIRMYWGNRIRTITKFVLLDLNKNIRK